MPTDIPDGDPLRGPHAPPRLVEAIANGHTAVFIGSGLSQAAGLPSWYDLLLSLIRTGTNQGLSAKDALALKRSVQEGDFLLVAEELRDRLGKEVFQEFMRDEFRRGGLKPISAHHLITQLPFCAALTTNYDNLIESAYTLASRGESPVTFTQRDLPELTGSLKHGFYILKLHGTIDRLDTIVLSLADYRALTYSNPTCALHLENVFTTKTVFFIGYSFRDPDLQLVLARLREISNNYIGGHYALMNTSELSPIRAKHFGKEFGIEIIPYSSVDTRHSEVATFLRDLVGRVQNYDQRKDEESTPLVTLRRLLVADPLGANFSEAVLEAKPRIQRAKDVKLTADFAALVADGFDILHSQYKNSDRLEYAAGCFLDAAIVMADVDDKECRKYLAASEALASTIPPGHGKDTMLARPHAFFHVAAACSNARLRRILRTLSYLAWNISGTYPGIEAARLLLDCGIGEHRKRLRVYLDDLSVLLTRRGHIHDGCIVCTSAAIEVLHSTSLWASMKLSRATSWLAEQRRFRWREKIAEGQSFTYGFNYPAAAMKALFLAGDLATSREISLLLLDAVEHGGEPDTSRWEGLDIDDYVATGRVLEALDFCGYLPSELRECGVRFLERRLHAISPRLLLREYDAWGLLGYLSCQRSVPDGLNRILLDLVSPVCWDKDGLWSGNYYRSAMTARVLLMATETGWRPVRTRKVEAP